MLAWHCFKIWNTWYIGWLAGACPAQHHWLPLSCCPVSVTPSRVRSVGVLRLTATHNTYMQPLT